MGSKPKAPKAPDYAALQKQQAEDNARALQAQTVANRPDQITPYGKISWQQDPTTGKWTQTESWDPRIQAMYEQSLSNQEAQLRQLQGLISRGQFQGPAITAKYDQAYADQYAKNFSDQLTARLKPQYEQDQRSMETRLRLQGLQPGTEAYDRAYQNLMRSQGDVISQANLQGQLAGQNEARAAYQTELGGQQAAYDRAMQEYLLPYQTLQATAGMPIQQYRPQYQGFTGAGQQQTPDIVGAAQQQYAQMMQQYNDKAASRESKGRSIGSVVGGVAGAFFGPVGASAGAAIGGAAGGALFSDPALKYNIGQLSDEACYNALIDVVPMTWFWNGTAVADAGVMADQIAERFPELVERSKSGALKVNYTALFAIQQGAFRHLAKELNNARRDV